MSKKYIESENPFTLQFSYIPPQYISRIRLTDEIVNDLKKEVPTFRGHFLTGVRGCGKSVLLAEIADILDQEKNWVIVDIERDEAEKLAKKTKGYSFAFQLLGYLYWKALCENEFDEINTLAIELEFEAYLGVFVYDKIWSELAPNEKKVIKVIAEASYNKTATVCKELGMEASKFSVYRSRIIDKGVLDGSEYGVVNLCLPNFGQYALIHN